MCNACYYYAANCSTTETRNEIERSYILATVHINDLFFESELTRLARMLLDNENTDRCYSGITTVDGVQIPFYVAYNASLIEEGPVLTLAFGEDYEYWCAISYDRKTRDYSYGASHDYCWLEDGQLFRSFREFVGNILETDFENDDND